MASPITILIGTHPNPATAGPRFRAPTAGGDENERADDELEQDEEDRVNDDEN